MSRASFLFIERALVFLAQAKLEKYPNARWLAEQCELSEPTAHRIIQALQDRFGAPLAYSNADRGFYLTQTSWNFPFEALGQDELEALLVAITLLRDLGDADLNQAGTLLWHRVAERFGTTAERLLRLVEGFSVDRTDRLFPDEPVLLIILDAIDRGRFLDVTYGSPWANKPPRRRQVRPLHLRASDGALYLKAEEEGKIKVFNLAFASDIVLGSPAPKEICDTSGWDQSFGIWQDEGAIEVSVWLDPPGSRYFARQKWTADQQDSWDQEILCRRIRAHPSPQLLRRLLSVAPWLRAVEPREVRDQLAAATSGLLKRLQDPS